MFCGPQSTEDLAAPVIARVAGQPFPPGPTLPQRLRTGALFRENAADFLVANARNYGDFVHFRANGRHIFQFNHPELAHAMLVRDAPHHHRGLVMQRARFVLGDGLLTSEEPLHMRQRRLTQPAFHRDRIAAYGAVIGQYAAEMSASWADRPVGPWAPGKTGTLLDVHEEMLVLALRIVGKCLFDADVQDQVQRVASAVDAFMSFLPLAFLPFPGALLRLPLPRMRRIRRGQAELDALIYAMIRQRRQSPGDYGDLLSMLLDAVDEEDGDGRMSDRQVRDECLTLLLAGHETTANALSFALWLLAWHPQAQERLHEEAQKALGRASATAADYPRLPFGQQVLAEAMRLYPPVWVTARTAAEPYEFCGYSIPRGALLLAPQIAIHRDARFWSEPGSFLPERFAADPKGGGKLGGRSRFAYFPFGAGSRQCIGEGLAWMEGVLTLATIVRDWRLSPPDGASPTLAISPRVTLRPRNGLVLRLERRA